jgi:hypothetical protein
VYVRTYHGRAYHGSTYVLHTYVRTMVRTYTCTYRYVHVYSSTYMCTYSSTFSSTMVPMVCIGTTRILWYVHSYHWLLTPMVHVYVPLYWYHGTIPWYGTRVPYTCTYKYNIISLSQKRGTRVLGYHGSYQLIKLVALSPTRFTVRTRVLYVRT